MVGSGDDLSQSQEDSSGGEDGGGEPHGAGAEDRLATATPETEAMGPPPPTAVWSPPLPSTLDMVLYSSQQMCKGAGSGIGLDSGCTSIKNLGNRKLQNQGK